MRVHVVLTVLLAPLACSAPREPAPASFTTPGATISGTPSSSPPVTSPTTSTAEATARPETVKGEDAPAKVRPELIACYEDGKKAVPTMTSGKITFHASVEPGGKTTCVVPSDDTGLTQDVENCMRALLEKETHAKRDATWSFALPLVVKDGKLGPGEMRATPPAMETIESHGLAEDVYDVIDALLPDLYGCLQGIPKSGALRIVQVGARVGASGQVECALASASGTIPQETRACTAKVLGRAKFRAPKKGYGLVSVPLNVMARK